MPGAACRVPQVEVSTVLHSLIERSSVVVVKRDPADPWT
jgi:hypothetical protein